MDEQTDFSRMERQLELRLTEITQIKAMLLKEIGRVQGEKSCGQAVRAACGKLQECAGALKEVMVSLRSEIMELPSILGEQTGCLLLKLKESMSSQWQLHRTETDRLKNELVAKTTHNSILQQRISELEKLVHSFERSEIECRTPLQQHLSSITDDGGRSPAIEYPAFRVDAMTEESVIVLGDDHDILSRFKIKQPKTEAQPIEQQVLKTEPHCPE